MMYNSNTVSKMEKGMDYLYIQEQTKGICQSENWRNLTGLIDDGYRGIFVVLRILQESEVDVSAGNLARLMNVSTARIARALNTLEKKNYIKREKDCLDARKVVIAITKEGECALEERKSAVEATLCGMLNKLTEEEVVVFFRILRKLLV